MGFSWLPEKVFQIDAGAQEANFARVLEKCFKWLDRDRCVRIKAGPSLIDEFLRNLTAGYGAEFISDAAAGLLGICSNPFGETLMGFHKSGSERGVFLQEANATR
jgi:hypothetical protein